MVEDNVNSTEIMKYLMREKELNTDTYEREQQKGRKKEKEMQRETMNWYGGS